MKNFISKFTRLPKSAKITALTSGFVALTLVFAGLGFALLGDSASNVAHTEHNVLTSLGTEILTESEVEAAVLDPIVEREIFDGVDTGLTGDIDELELVNVIYVKNTLADGNYVPNHYSISDVMGTGDVERLSEMFITQLDTMFPVYQVNEFSDYYIAFIDSFFNDERYTLQHADFAYWDFTGNAVDNVIFDTDTGIAYIPKVLYTEYTDDADFMGIQAQLLQVQHSGEIEGSSAVEILDLTEGDELEHAAYLYPIFNMATTVEAEAGLNAEDLAVAVNGIPVGDDLVDYDPNTGEVTVYMSSASIHSLTVDFAENVEATTALSSITPLNSGTITIGGRTFNSWMEVQFDGEPFPSGTRTTSTLAMFYRSHGPAFDDPHVTSFDYGTWAYQIYDLASKVINGGTVDVDRLREQTSFFYFGLQLDAATFPGGRITGGRASDGTHTTTTVIRCGYVVEPQLNEEIIDLLGDPIFVSNWPHVRDVNVAYRFFNMDHDTGTGFLGIISQPANGQNSFALVPIRFGITGDLTVEKRSSNTSITNNNPAYSLQGAEFALYQDGTRVPDSLRTTNAQGRATWLGLPAFETFEVREISAPLGFVLSTQGQNVEVVADTHITESFYNDPGITVPGPEIPTLLIQKTDLETGNPLPQGSAELAGAEFRVEFYGGFRDTTDTSWIADTTPIRSWVLTTDEQGIARLGADWLVSGDPLFMMNGNPVLPLGTITIQENAAGDGYHVNPQIFVRHITQESAGSEVAVFVPPTVPQQIIRGGVVVEKWDIETQSTTPQGSAALQGAVLEIVSNNPNPVRVAGESFTTGQVVHTMVTNAQGRATTTSDLLPFGTYTVREVTAPQGYLNAGNIERTFQVREDGVIVDLNTATTSIQNNVIRGGVEVEKVDRELSLLERVMPWLAQGDGDLEGIAFNITSNNEHPILVDGEWIEYGEVATTILTSHEGSEGSLRAIARTGDRSLPFGDYTIQEVATNDSYLLTDGDPRTFQVREDGVLVRATATGDDLVFSNYVVRGDVRLEKWDIELDKSEAIGGRDAVTGTTLEGIQFTIALASEQGILVDGEMFEPGEDIIAIYTFWCDEHSAYIAHTLNRTLPYGTYTIRESATNDSYLLTDGQPRTFQVREDGEVVTVDTDEENLVWRNQVRRADIEFVKIAERTHERLSVPFAITNVTTGEVRVAVTDRNGEFRSYASWNGRGDNTNANDSLLEYDARGETIPTSSMAELAPIWFGLGEFDSLADVSETLGALPYGKYTIRELRVENNVGFDLFEFEFFVFRDSVVMNLGTMTNFLTPGEPCDPEPCPPCPCEPSEPATQTPPSEPTTPSVPTTPTVPSEPTTAAPSEVTTPSVETTPAAPTASTPSTPVAPTPTSPTGPKTGDASSTRLIALAVAAALAITSIGIALVRNRGTNLATEGKSAVSENPWQNYWGT